MPYQHSLHTQASPTRANGSGSFGEDRVTTLRAVPRELLSGAGRRRGTLTALVGPRTGETFALSGEFSTIGRLPHCDITLSDPGVSRIHARVGRLGGAYYIEDLDSTNGCYVAGERLERPAILEEGAHIVIGDASVLRFALLDPMAEAASRRIYEATVRDQLTGLYNRRYLDERLCEDFAHAVRDDSPLCVMMIDIDHFKQVNDRFGHAMGDAALRVVAETIRAAVSADDLVARAGGEEFVVVARNVDPQGAWLLAERLRRAIASQRIRLDGVQLLVTVSVGVAHSDSELLLSRAEAMLKAADDALYRAKEDGRNRVCCAGPVGHLRQRRSPQRRKQLHAATTTRLRTHEGSDR